MKDLEAVISKTIQDLFAREGFNCSESELVSLIVKNYISNLDDCIQRVMNDDKDVNNKMQFSIECAIKKELKTNGMFLMCKNYGRFF